MAKIKLVKPIKVDCYNEKNNQETPVALCPACWNIKIGRAFLTAKLRNIGYRIKNDKDLIEGVYIPDISHLIGCPNERIFNEADQ